MMLNLVLIDLYFNNVFLIFYNFVLKYCILILVSNKMNKFLKKNNYRYMYIVFIKILIVVFCYY